MLIEQPYKVHDSVSLLSIRAPGEKVSTITRRLLECALQPDYTRVMSSREDAREKLIRLQPPIHQHERLVYTYDENSESVHSDELMLLTTSS